MALLTAASVAFDELAHVHYAFALVQRLVPPAVVLLEVAGEGLRWTRWQFAECEILRLVKHIYDYFN